MKTYPYNKASNQGRRLFQLLYAQYNKATLEPDRKGKTFDSYRVPSVMQCRVNKVGFLFPSNFTGIKRPQIQVDADVETAWGEFANDVTTLDFTHENQELPLTYTQPIEDDTMKYLIDAGLYRDERFEELISKLMQDELFDADAEMDVTHLDLGSANSELTNGRESVPVLLVDPVSVVHDEHDPSENTTIQSVLKRSAMLAIELRKDGFKSEQIVEETDYTEDREVYISDSFKDVIEDHAEKEIEESVEASDEFVESSELLDREIDVTDELKNSLGYNQTSEDDRIRELKEQEFVRKTATDTQRTFEDEDELEL